MDKNKIILIAQGLCRFVQGFLIFMGVLFTVVLVHWHFSPESYALVELPGGSKSGFYGQGFRIISVSYKAANPNAVILSQVSAGMLYWLYLRTLVIMTLTFFMFRSVRRILGSIKSLKTFCQDNIIAFQRIGKYALGIFVLTSFNLWIVPGDSDVNLNLALGPLLVGIFSLVMAEVFKEGNQLIEDRNLMI